MIGAHIIRLPSRKNRATWVILALLLMPRPTGAADRDIYPTNHATIPWTFQDVQDYLDPTACAARGGTINGQPCPVAGDTIIFNGHADGTEGIFSPPAAVGQSYRLRTEGVIVTCKNARFTGNEAQSPRLFRTFSGSITIRGCTFDANPSTNADAIWSESGFSPSGPVVVEGNTFLGFDKAYNWFNVSNAGDNSQPSVVVRANYFKDNQLGANFEKQSGAGGQVSLAMYAIFEDNTLEGIGAIGLVPVTYPQSTSGATVWIAPGIDRLNGNVFLTSPDGIPLAPEAYGAITPPGSYLGLVSGVGVPDNNGEFLVAGNVAQCPPSPPPGSTCYQGTFLAWYGGGNFVDDPKLSWSRRPKPGSPAVARKAGAFPPVFDTGARTGDWQVTKAEDFEGEKGFRTAFYESTILGNLTPDLQSIHDVNGDGSVDWYDFDNTQDGGFVQACTGCSKEELVPQR